MTGDFWIVELTPRERGRYGSALLCSLLCIGASAKSAKLDSNPGRYIGHAWPNLILESSVSYPIWWFLRQETPTITYLRLRQAAFAFPWLRIKKKKKMMMMMMIAVILAVLFYIWRGLRYCTYVDSHACRTGRTTIHRRQTWDAGSLLTTHHSSVMEAY